MQPKNSIEPMKIPDRGRHLNMEVFINRILNYRYHWHETKYEVTTVLRGRAIYSRGGEAVELGEDDLVVIEPLMGHASLALEKGTLTMTAYFGYNRTYLSTFFKTNTGLNFHDYLTRIRLKHSLSDLAYTDKHIGLQTDRPGSGEGRERRQPPTARSVRSLLPCQALQLQPAGSGVMSAPPMV